MKRIGCVLLACVMLLFCMTFFVGAESPALVIAADGVSGEAGDAVTVAVRLTDNPGLSSMILQLSYDTTLLTLTQAENKELFEGWYQASPSIDTLPYRMVWVTASAQSETGDLILLEFKISEGASVGAVASLTLNVTEAYCNGEAFTAAPVQTEITVICNHTYGDPTSVDASTHKQECSKCHHEITAAHEWDEGSVTTPATHLEIGTMTFTCTECGATRTEDIPKDTTHTYSDWEKHDAEQHKKTCACGDIQYADHKWDEGSVTTPATHLEIGTMTFTCTECGATRTEDISKDTTHTYGDWEKHDAEQHKKTCACGDIQYAAHEWDEGSVTTPATHLEIGTMTFTCADCGATRTEDIPKDTTHTYGDWEKHDAEQHKKTCACGDIQYAAHEWDEGSVTTPATHFEIGTMTFTCTECGATRTEDIPKDTTHTYGDWEKHDAEQHKKTCACGDIQYAAHEWDEGSVTKPATTSEEGVKTFTCVGCGFERIEDIPKIAILSPEGWILPVLIALVVIAIAAIVLILILKRRKKRPTPTAPQKPNGKAVEPEVSKDIPIADGTPEHTEVPEEKAEEPSTEEPTAEPDDGPSVASAAILMETPDESGMAQDALAEAPSEEPAEESVGEPAKAITDDGAAEPTEENTDESAKDIAEDPECEAADAPLQEQTIEPNEEPKPDADGEPADQTLSDAENEGGEAPPENPTPDATVPESDTDETTKTPGEQEEMNK